MVNSREIIRSGPLTIFGFDLAWGEKNRDGICRMSFPDGLNGKPCRIASSLTHGDDALLKAVKECRTNTIFLAIDAPTLAPNESGSRPVDRECSQRFRKQEAGCHPANRRLCQRPLRVADALRNEGFLLSPDFTKGNKLAAEVYPHPAMVRWFGLGKTIKYKRGRIVERRAEFSRYQSLLWEFLCDEFPHLLSDEVVEELLSLAWTKDQEDRLDALLCALIGWWHLRFGGKKSEILGNDISGHILLPAER
ncbi:DUF429 domain-containing protein [Verrucomicrobiales bacterium]|nr:DUF429 domain-containing protein [Verrucomicrobiales bacterium]MDB2642756.1 DUF429 domain-containing protein [bacterium]